MIFKNLFLLLFLIQTTQLFAKYTNCTFQNENYSDICQKVVKNGVSIEYANRFLLSFRTKLTDKVSWKYLQPNKIKQHRLNEKRANISLAKRYLPMMLKNLKKYKKVYDYVEKKYGVNREVIAAILLKETKFGTIKLRHDAFIVFNTMVLKSPAQTSREKWLLRMGKENIAELIKYCYKGNIKPNQCQLGSSYAGAVGIAQFMPTSFTYAKSYKNKTPKLWKMEDAIVSVASYLHQKANWNKLLDWSKVPNMLDIEKAWYDFELMNDNASFVYAKSKRTGKKFACYGCRFKKLAYIKEYAKKVMKYNNSSNYAIGVLSLAYNAHKHLRR